MACIQSYLPAAESRYSRSNISEALQFIPTIFVRGTVLALAVNEMEFVKMTHRILADDYVYLKKRLAECVNVDRNTNTDVLACFDFNGFDKPEVEALPVRWFDPFAWRYALTRRFEEYIMTNAVIFDAYGDMYKIKSQLSVEIEIDKIKWIEYEIETIRAL